MCVVLSSTGSEWVTPLSHKATLTMPLKKLMPSIVAGQTTAVPSTLVAPYGALHILSARFLQLLGIIRVTCCTGFLFPSTLNVGSQVWVWWCQLGSTPAYFGVLLPHFRTDNLPSASRGEVVLSLSTHFKDSPSYLFRGWVNNME